MGKVLKSSPCSRIQILQQSETNTELKDEIWRAIIPFYTGQVWLYAYLNTMLDWGYSNDLGIEPIELKCRNATSFGTCL